MEPSSGRTRQKTVAVLGATGSIGSATLDLIASQPDQFRVTLLSASKNAEALAELALVHKPDHVVLMDEKGMKTLSERLNGTGIKVHHAMDALVALLAEDCDITVNGIGGIAGLTPSLAVVKRGGLIAMANKETLVAAGGMLMAEAERSGATILPADSEHNAIFQVWSEQHRNRIEAITLTASGGPFLDVEASRLAEVTPDEALRHPNWSMGRKITIDSATMMNKGLEVIEACVLFGLDEDKVEVLVHPQSVIHGMVSYSDGSTLAQLGTADMRVPLSYVLAWPDRMYRRAEPVCLSSLGRLDFMEVDDARFPAVNLSRQAWRQGGLAPCVLNAANEIAVESFLAGRVGFLDIVGVVDHILGSLEFGGEVTLDAVLSTDRLAKAAALTHIETRTR